MSLRLPKCDFCKHYIDDPNIKGYCCEAFPYGIPSEKIKYFKKEDEENEECNNGIKYEEE